MGARLTGKNNNRQFLSINASNLTKGQEYGKAITLIYGDISVHDQLMPARGGKPAAVAATFSIAAGFSWRRGILYSRFFLYMKRLGWIKC
jgi:hypothetical protein